MSISKRHIENSSGQTQADKFRALARQLECDDDEEAFKAKLRQVVTTPPQHQTRAKSSE